MAYEKLVEIYPLRIKCKYIMKNKTGCVEIRKYMCHLYAS